jgi:hypothetical protein
LFALSKVATRMTAMTITTERRRATQHTIPQPVEERSEEIAAPSVARPSWLDADGIDVLDVDVTEDDIDHGRRCQPMWCMVAVAVRRHFGLTERRSYRWGRAWDDRRRDARLWVGRPTEEARWVIIHAGAESLVPREVGELIESWDVGSPIEAFRFSAVRTR